SRRATHGARGETPRPPADTRSPSRRPYHAPAWTATLRAGTLRAMAGPLDGVRVIELAGLGALPFGTLKLADMGADVIRVERTSEVPSDPVARPHNFWDRGRRSIAVDLKHPDGVATVLRLAESAD